MLNMFFEPYIIFRSLAVLFIISLVLRIFKIKIEGKHVYNLEFLFMGLGHALSRKPFKAFGFFLVSSFYYALVFTNVKPYLMNWWERGSYVGFAISTLLTFGLLLCFVKTSRDSVYSKYPRPKENWFGYSKENDGVRDHMEYHHHDSGMP